MSEDSDVGVKFKCFLSVCRAYCNLSAGRSGKGLGDHKQLKTAETSL